MHELSVCQALLDEVKNVALAHAASRVEEIVVAVGPLSGVDPSLLACVFEVARHGCCAGAELRLQSAPLRVRCEACGAESSCKANALLCRQCGAYVVSVVSGDELRLMSVRLAAAAPLEPPNGGICDV
jgi:hydrogenase nickel incorporation protein HypA/HybF